MNHEENHETFFKPSWELL